MKESIVTALTSLGIVLSPMLMKFAGTSPAEASDVQIDDHAEVFCTRQADTPVHKRYGGRGDIEARLEADAVVQVLSRRKNWRHVLYVADDKPETGWVTTKYLQFCEEDESDVAPTSSAAITAVPPAPGSSINVCSFNIQFLGHFKDRDNVAVASLLEPCDVAVIQELVAPPYAVTLPDGGEATPDAEASAFFDEMDALGFEHVLSEEDTGTGEEIHDNGPATEWWVAFYRSAKLQVATDLPRGFLADDRSDHPDYERVPYAFAFRSANKHLDFVLVSVHLEPGSSKASKARRKHELASIASWVDAHDDAEGDFIILGDMNIENAAELASAAPDGFTSLNGDVRPTNTNINSPKPYDHIMFRAAHTTVLDGAGGMGIVDLIAAMYPHWTGSGPYPGDPYVHNAFRTRYSDHHPVWMTMRIPAQDND